MEESSKKITYESLWKAIIRPPRDYYTNEDLGPNFFSYYGKSYIRKDFEIIDFQGKMLKVSFIEPDNISRPYDIMPCVIYVHANSSSRVEGINIKNCLLKKNINVCAFDFEGSGYSEGEYISLGYHEKFQLKNIVDFVENYPGVGEIGLWGRSMGAATSLLFASMDKRIKAIVVDSPFADFRRVAKEMCMAQVSIPGFLIEGAISIIGKSVYNKNKMKINEIKPIESVKKCDIPVIFVHAKDDDMVNFQHTLDLYNNYRGIFKEIKEVSGGHNSKRPSYIMDYCAKFFAKNLKDNNTKEENEENNFNYNQEGNNNINNFEIKIPKHENKTIYEKFGIKNPNLKKADSKKNDIDTNQEIINIKNEIKEEDGKKMENNNIKIDKKNNENQKEINVENLKDKKNKNIEGEIKENENDDKIKNDELKMKNIQQNNKININDTKSGRNMTFYNTNTNFNSFINACINNNNKTNNDFINNINNDLTNEENNININLISNMPKRTIYDDLKLRPKG